MVEDEQKLADLLRDAIGEYFGDFWVMYDGKSGLEAAQKYKPDIVITDITMPHMNGLEMSALLREERDDLPIVILSAYSDKNYLLSAIDMGVTKYLIKPFDPDQLLDVLCHIARRLRIDTRVQLISPFGYDYDIQKLFVGDEIVKLSKRENNFINMLLASPNYFMSSGDIKLSLWDDEDASDERLRVFINRLRSKTDQKLIVNVIGQGYYLATDKSSKR